MAAESQALQNYESEMFLELTEEDGLFVTARGISTLNVLTNFLKMYCDPAALVIVVNASDYEENHIIEDLKAAGALVPKRITTEFSSSDRESIYLSGGVLFVTSRILVVDMLTNKIPVHLLTGIVVLKAHKIVESCQEAFILRLYRQNNKAGFIKAFSNQPTAFLSGFCKVERVMKNLFVRKLLLWPRFQATINDTLEKHKPEVVELHLQLTPCMTAIQMAILDLIDNCLKELRRANPSLDPDDINVENGIHKAFDKQLHLQLDPIWHKVSIKTKQLVADLKVLRLILFYLTQYDCVTFYSFLESLRASQRDVTRQSLWMFMDAADSLFVHAKERVYGSGQSKKGKRPKTDVKEKPNKKREELQEDYKMEENPKWKLLADILEEIEADEAKNKDMDPCHILVAAYDGRTCYQIKEYLCHGSEILLTRILQKMTNEPVIVGGEPVIPVDPDVEMETECKEDPGTSAQLVKQNMTKSRRGRGRTGRGKGKIDPKQARLLDAAKESNNQEQTKTMSPGILQGQVKNIFLKAYDTKDETDKQDTGVQIMNSPVTVIHPLVGCSDPFSLIKTLEEIEPRYVILYDAEMEFVRQLEVYKASRPGVPLRVYFLIYAGSVEEQKYLTTLRKEKEAFEMLIKEKATMVIPEEREGKTEAAMSLSRDPSKATDVIDTRKAGGREKDDKETRKIIVDMREFRSELPSLIHRRGIDIEPVTLEVGDYILSPDMCVERKSISDLIGSLNNGRLYNQAVSMTRYYKRPLLLIEFDQNKSFALQTNSSVSNEISIQDVTSKLALLTLHFPKLRILWCHSPYATAELFDELKGENPEPDAAVAVSIGTDSSSVSESKYNIGPQDFLLKMPGINYKNFKCIMNEVKDIHELCQLSEERLTEILENTNTAKTLWEFLHVKKDDARAPVISSSSTAKGKRK